MTSADRSARLAATVVVMLGAWGCGADGPSDATPIGGPVDGAEVYRFRCQACHGEQGEGATGPRVDEPEMWDRLGDDGVREVIAEGVGNMAGYQGLIPDAEIDAVVQYVRTLTG